VAACDLECNDIQSLMQLPTTRKIYPGITEASDERERDWEDNATMLRVEYADAQGNAEDIGWVNIAAGNFVLDIWRYDQYNKSRAPDLRGPQGVIPWNGGDLVDDIWVTPLETHFGISTDIFGTAHYLTPGAVETQDFVDAAKRADDPGWFQQSPSWVWQDYALYTGTTDPGHVIAGV
jgi:hypothetical protein